MRLIPYNTLDEILEDSRVVSKSHNGNVALSWMPDRLKLLAILGCDFAKLIIRVTEKLDNSAIERIDIFPSEYVKAAHNLQLSAKQTRTINEEDLVSAYIKLTNCSIIRRNFLMGKYKKALLSSDISFYSIKNESEKNKLLFLNAILRACSETIYFDNHTSAGDTIGPIEYNSEKVLVKSFNSIISDYIFPSTEFQSLFKNINIYMKYKKLDTQFDMIGNHISKYDININLSGYCIEITANNGASYNLDICQAEYIIEHYTQILREYTRKAELLSYPDKLRSVLRCIIQIYSPIFYYYNVPYYLNQNKVNSIIKKYAEGDYCSTEMIFSEFSYESAIEMIINPKIKYINNCLEENL